MTDLGRKIFELREQGVSRKKIAKILSCSTGSITYHLSGEKGREKGRLRINKYRIMHPFKIKLRKFKDRIYKNKIISSKSSIKKSIYAKIRTFHKINHKEYISMENANFTVDEVIKKYNDNPRCYLTGESININKPSSYAFDHIVPRSRGGTNTLDNLGICTKKANASKTDMTKDEYIEHCKAVLLHNGFDIIKR